MIDADGLIRHWHTTTGQLMDTIRDDKDVDVQMLHVSYSTAGDQFVSSGSDGNIRVFDGHTHKSMYNSRNMYIPLNVSEEQGEIGHTNRIFCAKYHPTDPNMIISGGWDDTIQVWDTRVPNPVRRIFGPRICGDSLDFSTSGVHILTGSYRKDNALQIFSWLEGRLVETIPWAPFEVDQPLAMLYTSQFSVPNRFIVAGSSGAANQVKLFSMETKKVVGVVDNLNCAIYSTAISADEKLVAAAGGGKMVILSEVDESATDDK